MSFSHSSFSSNNRQYRSSIMEYFTAQCHLHAISLFIPVTSENFSVPARPASIALITVSCPEVLALSTTLILAN